MRANDTERRELTQAVDLLKQGKWPEAMRAHEQLIKRGVHKAAGYYGLGVIQLQLGELDEATDSFGACLKEDSSNAHAVYHLGVIAKRQDDIPKARAAFSKALKMDPSMGDALKGLRSLPATTRHPNGRAPHADVPQEEPREATITNEGVADAASSGAVYELLQNDSSEGARKVVALIERLTMTRKPRRSAYRFVFLLAQLPLWLSLFGLPFVVYSWRIWSASHWTYKWYQADVFEWVPLMGISILIAAVLYGFLSLRLKSTTFRLNWGRIDIEKGVIWRRRHNYELFRVTDIQLRQSLLNRWTHDGTIVLTMELMGGGKLAPYIKLRGLAEYSELEIIFRDLRELVFLMRSLPLIKGIIR